MPLFKGNTITSGLTEKLNILKSKELTFHQFSVRQQIIESFSRGPGLRTMYRSG